MADEKFSNFLTDIIDADLAEGKVDVVLVGAVGIENARPFTYSTYSSVNLSISGWYNSFSLIFLSRLL